MKDSTPLHRVVLFITNIEDIPEDEVKILLEDNRHLGINIKDFKTSLIQDWDDDHVLNQTKATLQDFESFFPELKVAGSTDDKTQDLLKDFNDLKKLHLQAVDELKNQTHKVKELETKLAKYADIKSLVDKIKSS